MRLLVLALLLAPSIAAADDRIAIQGSMSPALIRRALHRTAEPELRRCYGERLRQRPRLRGRWRARFAIGGDGRVVSVQTVESDLADPAFEQCAALALRNAIFPAAPGVTMVTLTFVLGPHSSRSPPRVSLDDRRPYPIVPP